MAICLESPIEARLGDRTSESNAVLNCLLVSNGVKLSLSFGGYSDVTVTAPTMTLQFLSSTS